MDPGCRGGGCGVETRPRRGCGAVSVELLPKADGLRGKLVGSRGAGVRGERGECFLNSFRERFGRMARAGWRRRW